jgi:putative endonuclease
MKPENTSKKQRNIEIGRLGEDVACKYLISKGFELLQRNYRKSFAEIDIISKIACTVHFVEVKTVSYETRAQLDYSVAHETWKPEEQVHVFKLKQIAKGVEVWIMENNYSGDFQIDVIAIRVVPRETFAKVKFIDNVTVD